MNSQTPFRHDLDIDFPLGFAVRSGTCGVRRYTYGRPSERPDVGIVLCPEGATCHALLSRNTFRSKSLDDARSKLARRIRAIGVFSGNANACNGAAELRAIIQVCAVIARAVDCLPHEVICSFTGVIARPFPATAIAGALAEIAAGKQGQGVPFFRAIMTTDTRPKVAATSLRLAGREVRLAGCAKGAGMIAPNMATMLAYLTTDLDVPRAVLRSLLVSAADRSFHSMLVDNDTSTNDSLFFLSSGKSGVRWADIGVKGQAQFARAVENLCRYLATAVARDGEGATRLVTVTVRGASSEVDARRAVRSVISSLLVKTAIFGADPNYGRLLMALGNANITATPERTRLYFGKLLVYDRGRSFPEKLGEASAYLKSGGDTDILIDLGMGKFSWTGWTCDISYEYVKINAEYTT